MTQTSIAAALNGPALKRRDTQPDPREIRACLAAGRAARSTVRGVAHFLAGLAGYLVAFLATAVVPGWLAKMGCACASFYFLSRLALVGHDCGHGSLTASPALNRWLGRLAFLPALHPYATWVASHNALHHAFTNLRGKDPLWAPLSKEEFDALPRARRALERCYRTVPGVGIYYVVEIWWKTMLFPGGAVRARVRGRRACAVERLAVPFVLGAQVVGLLAWRQLLARTFGWPEAPAPAVLAAGVVLPFLLLSWWVGMLGFLHHTHPRVRWYADAEEWRRARCGLEHTVQLLAPWPVSWLLGHSLEHTAHHADPRIPFPALASCQQRLAEAYAPALPRVRLSDCCRILAACKLYDYQRHCWLDYTGRPTAEAGSHD
jgi:omega-6 fatty acid desaturase (delta-12 desaturase)